MTFPTGRTTAGKKEVTSPGGSVNLSTGKRALTTSDWTVVTGKVSLPRARTRLTLHLPLPSPSDRVQISAIEPSYVPSSFHELSIVLRSLLIASFFPRLSSFFLFPSRFLESLSSFFCSLFLFFFVNGLFPRVFFLLIAFLFFRFARSSFSSRLFFSLVVSFRIFSFLFLFSFLYLFYSSLLPFFFLSYFF